LEQLSFDNYGVTVPRPVGWQPDIPPERIEAGEVAIDFETTGLKHWRGDRPVGVSAAWRERDGVLRSVYLPFGHKGGGNLDEVQVKRWFKSTLRGKHLFGLNLPFDAHMSHAWGADLEEMGCQVGDVGHRAALLDDYRRDFTLESIAQDELGTGKVQGLDGAKICEYPAWMVADYGRTDSELVLRILEKQKPRLDEQGLNEVVALEDECIFPTLEMERNGALIDIEKLAGWVKESERELSQLLQRLAAEAGFRCDPNKVDDMARLFHVRGIPIKDWTAGSADGRTKPRPSFTDTILEAAAEHDEVIALSRQIGHLDDLRSKYLVPYFKTAAADGILRYNLNQLKCDEGGTISGRYSASQVGGEGEKEGANIQQVIAVKKQQRIHEGRYIVRELFIPAPGMRFASGDAKQIEYRVFADLSQSPRLLGAYAKDPELDYHELTGAIVKAYRPDFERARLKTCNFMVLFGGGAGTTAAQLGISESEAREVLEAYDTALPEARALLKQAAKIAQTRGYIKTRSGRRARFKPCPKHGTSGSRTPCGYCPRWHKALNSAVQGTAADINKRKVTRVYKQRHAIGFTMRMTIHDELAGDVPDQAAADRLSEVLEVQEYPEMKVPILWDLKVGDNWAQCK